MGAQHMLIGISEAISALTIAGQRRGSVEFTGRSQAVFLASFPLVGLAFGLVGLIGIELLAPSLPVLAAWLVPTLWLLLSGGRHFADFARFSEAVLFPGTAEERLSVMRQSGALPLAGLALAVAVYTGKVIALMQAQLMDVHSIAVIVLVLPLFGRYVAALVAISGERPISPCSELLKDYKLHAVGGASVFVLLSLVKYLTLSLALLVTVMAVGVLMRLIAEQRLGGLYAACVSAVIELAELAGILVVVAFSGAGINLVYY